MRCRALVTRRGLVTLAAVVRGASALSTPARRLHDVARRYEPLRRHPTLFDPERVADWLSPEFVELARTVDACPPQLRVEAFEIFSFNVQEVSRDTFEDIQGFRCLLEVSSVEEILDRIRPSDIDELRRTNASLLKSDPIDVASEHDFAFHTRLIAVLGNKAILDVYTLLKPVILRIMQKRKSRHTCLGPWSGLPPILLGRLLCLQTPRLARLDGAPKCRAATRRRLLRCFAFVVWRDDTAPTSTPRPTVCPSAS